MSDFADQYIKQIQDNIGPIHDALFPKAKMDAFAKSADEDIAAGKNICVCGEKTMERLWPGGAWLCPKHAQEMWSEGLITRMGAVVMNMEKPDA